MDEPAHAARDESAHAARGESAHAARGEPADAIAQDLLSIEEIGRRASGGAALLVARGALMLAFGLVANVVLARLLERRDFGIVAPCRVLITRGRFLADGARGSGLIRRHEPPRRRELEAVNCM